MRIRCIAFILPAALITAAILLLTSAIVSGLESRFSASEPSSVFEIVRHETECDGLWRRIAQVARGGHSCEAMPGCLSSQNICPLTLQREFAAAYEELRQTVESRCGDLRRSVTRVSTTCVATPYPTRRDSSFPESLSEFFPESSPALQSESPSGSEMESRLASPETYFF